MNNQIKINCLGPAGSYGHEAARLAVAKLELTGAELDFQPTNTSILETVLRTIEAGSLGIVPVENSTAGDVVDVMAFLARQPPASPLGIIGEIILPVRHCLLVPPGLNAVAELQGIASHPQAISQCGESIRRWGFTPAQIEPANSTAGAAKLVFEQPEKKMGALASAFAGATYGLKTLEADVQTRSDNATRFFVFGRKRLIAPTGDDKSVIIFQTKNRPGALLCALLPLGLLGVNLTAIHSVAQGGWSYSFYIETNAHAENPRLRLALRAARFFVKNLSILGSFPK